VSAPGPEAEAPKQVVVDGKRPPRRPTPRILLTNDDGIDSPGLRLLAAELARDHELVVAAPDTDWSGSGTGIGRFDPARGVDFRPTPLDGAEAYVVSGPPGLVVLASALGAFGPKPDLVVSGINAGMNTGHSVIHSGTVGAVLTARTFGSHGLAVSLAPSDPWHWTSAVAVARAVAEWILRREDEPIVLNVNVPAEPLARLGPPRWARLDQFGYFRVALADTAGGKLVFEITGADAGRDPHSDTALCRERHVTITPLSAIEADPFPPALADELWRPAP
jgi:5'-nucleotidase